MSLIDVLRGARTHPVSILHEFKLFFDPGRRQVHAFVEGQADKTFYSNFISPRLGADVRLHFYDCKGKRPVLESMLLVRAAYPDARTLLFFVDKDLDDLIGPQPTANELFCTEVYSIENYIMDSGAIIRWFEETWHLSGVHFDFSLMEEVFANEMRRFTARMLPIMAWILAHRIAGNRPVLASIDLNKLLRIDDDGAISRRTDTGPRLRYLDRVTQVTTDRHHLVEAKRWMKTLMTLNPLEWLRGKFAMWFLCAFIRRIEGMAKVVATEAGGTITCRVQPHEKIMVDCIVNKIQEPPRLTAFLNLWLPSIHT